MPATMPRQPRRDAVRSHRLVVDAARELFGEFGIDASMEQIAARAGVGVGTVYRRFPGKESLVEELVKLVTGELVDAGRQALDGDDGSGLEAYLRMVGASFAEHRRWADQLLFRRFDSGAAEVRGQIAQLFANAHRVGTVGPHVRLGDVMAMLWGMRGLVQTAGEVAPDAWQRYLDIHLIALRTPDPLSTTPAITETQLRSLL